MNASDIARFVGFARRKGSGRYGADRIAERGTRGLVVLVDADAPEKCREGHKRKCGDAPVSEMECLAAAAHRDFG